MREDIFISSQIEQNVNYMHQTEGKNIVSIGKSSNEIKVNYVQFIYKFVVSLKKYCVWFGAVFIFCNAKSKIRAFIGNQSGA